MAADVLSRISASNSGKKVGDTTVYPAGSYRNWSGELLQKEKIIRVTTDTKDRDRRKHNDVSSASRIFM